MANMAIPGHEKYKWVTDFALVFSCPFFLTMIFAYCAVLWNCPRSRVSLLEQQILYIHILFAWIRIQLISLHIVSKLVVADVLVTVCRKDMSAALKPVNFHV